MYCDLRNSLFSLKKKNPDLFWKYKGAGCLKMRFLLRLNLWTPAGIGDKVFLIPSGKPFYLYVSLFLEVVLCFALFSIVDAIVGI